MKTPRKYSVAETRRIIDYAWLHFAQAASRYGEYSAAFDAECKAEKEHRAFGARFTKGAARYRLPAHYAAKLFVLQHTYEAMPLPTTWLDFAGYATRVVVCQALRDRLILDSRFDAAFGLITTADGETLPEKPAFMFLDYAADVAA